MNTSNASLTKKHAARLAAVQCLYQRGFLPELSADALIVARLGMEGEEDATEEEFEPLPAVPDAKLLRGIVTGAMEQSDEIERRLSEALAEKWTGHRMPQLMRALLRAAAYELIYHPSLASRIVLSEYVTVASGFFDDAETGFVNATLQHLAPFLRGEPS